MYRLLATVLVLVGFILAQNSAPEDLLHHAMELQHSGDLEGAVQGYRAFLAQRPNEAPVRSNLGVLLARLGRYDEAVAEYNQAVSLDPNNSGIVLNLGLAYYKSGRIAEAAQAFSKARAMAPDNLQTALLLADCQLRMSQNRAVVSLLAPLESQNQDNLAITYLLGMALIRDGQVEEGQLRVDRILRSGDSAEARYLLGSQMFAAGDSPAAVKQLAGALELNPDLPGAQSLYGQALLNTGDPDAASEAFRKELAADPNHFEAQLYLAQILIARKQWEEAAPLLQRALQVRPDAFEPKLALADLNVGRGRLKEASLELEALEKAQPQSVAVHRRLAAVYEALHLKNDAAREGKLAAALEPKETNADHQPNAGDLAPEFRATKLGSKVAVTLAQLRAGSAVLLVFGSYTCPNFRAAANTLNKLYPRYRNHTPFYMIYIREAHSTTDWQSTQNERERIVLPAARTINEQQEHATMCVRKLRIEFPALLDSMNGAAERAYSAWPSKAFVIDKHGRILYSTGLSEQDFRPERLEAALRHVGPAVQASRLPGKAQ